MVVPTDATRQRKEAPDGIRVGGKAPDSAQLTPSATMRYARSGVMLLLLRCERKFATACGVRPRLVRHGLGPSGADGALTTASALRKQDFSAPRRLSGIGGGKRRLGAHLRAPRISEIPSMTTTGARLRRLRGDTNQATAAAMLGVAPGSPRNWPVWPWVNGFGWISSLCAICCSPPSADASTANTAARMIGMAVLSAGCASGFRW